MLFENTRSHELLSTKLSLPRRGSARILRTKLLERLDAGWGQKLTLISAPAGSGKTSLVADWVDGLPAGTAAWVSLDAGDNDPVRFWRYVFAAVETVDPQAGEAALRLLCGAQQADEEAILTTLINLLSQRAERLVLALEDYHQITNPDIHAAVAFLVDNLPPPLHLALLTRSEPPLPLGRWRARNEINELRAADLRFSLPEAHAFLQQALARPLTERSAARLVERTEGWAAGLRLAALALQGHPAQENLDEVLDGFIETFAGSHRPLLDYVLADVLAGLDLADQTFLLETSLLERLNAGLCDAVTGREDSAAVLDRLERLNLFIESLDGAGEWRRYHALFAEAMRYLAGQRLGAARRRELTLNAARWYAGHEMLSEAVEAALSASEYELAAGWIEQCVTPRLAGNEYHTLLRWIESLPLETRRSRPGLCLTHALAILFISETGPRLPVERLQAPLELAEAGWSAQGNADRLAEVTAVRALAAGRGGEYAVAHTLAVQALERLPSTAIEWRGISLSFAGWGQYYAGRMDAALSELSQSLALCRQVGNLYGVLSAALGLAQVHAERGAPQAAVELYHQTLAELERAPVARKDRLRRQAKALLGLAELAYEAGDLSAAEQQASQALDMAAELGSGDLLPETEWLLARVVAAGGNLPAARRRLYALAARIQHPMLIGQLQFWQARLALAAGDLTHAQRWAAAAGAARNLPPLFRTQHVLLMKRLQITQGEPEAALPGLEDLLVEVRAGGRARREAEILLVMSQAQIATGQRSAALRSLAEAQALAPPERYRRVYLDEGDAITALLEQTQGVSKAATTAVAPLWQPAGPAKGRGAPAAPGGPLSQQETRVLRLLAVGMSNPEIADELVVSVNTVKSHVKSIYRKLNVNSRRSVRQAAHRYEKIF